jgi:peptidoglycan/LPS O-acetylase OafA/YrhL
MNFAKTIAMIVATVLSAIVAALVGDNVITAHEWINVAITAVGAAAVFTAPNVPGAMYVKQVLAVLAAVLVLLNNVIDGGIDLSEWLQLALAALGALGVVAAPYTPFNMQGVTGTNAAPNAPPM